MVSCLIAFGKRGLVMVGPSGIADNTVTRSCKY